MKFKPDAPLIKTYEIWAVDRDTVRGEDRYWRTFQFGEEETMLEAMREYARQEFITASLHIYPIYPIRDHDYTCPYLIMAHEEHLGTFGIFAIHVALDGVWL